MHGCERVDFVLVQPHGSQENKSFLNLDENYNVVYNIYYGFFYGLVINYCLHFIISQHTYFGRYKYI